MTKKKTTKRERKYAQDFSGVSKTDRSFAPAHDVNNIVRHYENTGLDPYESRLANKRFGYATSKTYLEAQREIAEINTAFNELPSAQRAYFQNDPALWIEAGHRAANPDPGPENPEPKPEPQPEPESQEIDENKEPET